MADSQNVTINYAPGIMASPNTGIFGCRKARQPIFIALLIIGALGLGAAAAGLAGFGTHQGWWSSHLSNLNQIQSISLMAGGTAGALLFFTGGIIGAMKARPPMNLLLPLTIKSAYNDVDTTYNRTDDKGILDLVYFNTELGFGCAVDGTGHSNRRMQEPLKRHFDRFIEQYSKGLEETYFRTKEELEKYFVNAIRNLEKQFKDKTLDENKIKVHPEDKQIPDDGVCGTFLDPTYKPAMSFVQLMLVRDALILLSAQAGDTMIVVELSDGQLALIQKSTLTGVGDPVEPVHIKACDISGAKRVIGLSDGIGEYLTIDELKEVINESNSDVLLKNLKEKVMTRRSIQSNGTAANGGRLKSYDENDLNKSDDISLFVLDLV